MVFYSGVIKIFLAVCQKIVKDVEKIFKSYYQDIMGFSKANSDIKTYIKDVFAEKKDGKKLVVGNPELINKITDVLVQQRNEILVCHTDFLFCVLTEADSFEWLSKLKIYIARCGKCRLIKIFIQAM